MYFCFVLLIDFLIYFLKKRKLIRKRIVAKCSCNFFCFSFFLFCEIKWTSFSLPFFFTKKKLINLQTTMGFWEGNIKFSFLLFFFFKKQGDNGWLRKEWMLHPSFFFFFSFSKTKSRMVRYNFLQKVEWVFRHFCCFFSSFWWLFFCILSLKMEKF